MGKLDGKVAVITGGSAGIGLATARRFRDEGAHVYLSGRRQARVDAAVAALGEGVVGVVGDVTKADQLDAFFERVRQDRGRVDVLFACAAHLEERALTDVDDVHFDRTFDTNVRGVLFAVQRALRLMPDGGAIVLAGSPGAHRGLPDHGLYAASKAAVRSLARTWTAELAPRNIRVNLVTAGPTLTEGAIEMFGDEAAARAHFDEIAAFVPAGRAAEPDEIAAAVLFLVSDEGRYFRGAELAIDGGLGQI